jgi:hypothetical protein
MWGSLSQAQAGSFLPPYSVPSLNSKTLRFTLEETLGACAFSQMSPGIGCPDIGLFVPIGDTSVAVYNRNGTSNSVQFTRELSSVENAEEDVKASPERAQLLQLFEDNYRTSISPFRGLWLEGYGIGVEEEDDGDVYISVSLHGSNLEELIEAIPEEIAGYEVRVTAN